MSHIPIQDILKYMNDARTNPQQFSQHIKKQIDSFLDDRSLPLMANCTYSTNQGKKAWLQAYDFVKNHKPLHKFQLNEGLNFAALDHAIDMKDNNFFGHSSSDGTSFGGRIQRRCGQSYGGSAQCLGSEFNVQGRNHALQTILGLIIDDGVSSRGHRKSIYSDKYKYVGIYTVLSGDKIKTCIDFHSQNQKTVDSSSNPIVPKGGSGHKQQASKLPTKGTGTVSTQGKQSGEKKIVSKSTSTKTSTKNGVTIKVVTTKLKYSDGSTEQTIEETKSSS